MKRTRIHALLIGAMTMVCLPGQAQRDFKKGYSPTAALDDSAWASSEWISAANAPVMSDTIREDSRAADGSSWFVGEFQNKKRIQSAKWMVTSLGVFDLYVNGQAVGDEILRPGYTHYAKTRRSFTYDVTGLMRTKKGARNVLSAEVTPGWWADKIVTLGKSVGMNGRKCAFRGVLELTYADGSRELIGTDTEHWRSGIAGPVSHAAIYDGEEYDARLLPGHATPSLLSTPELNDEFHGEILPTGGAEVYLRPDLTLQPQRAYVWRDVEGSSEAAHGKVVVAREYKAGEPMTIDAGDHLVVDFGQNCAALPWFEFQAAEGVRLTCLPAELLNDSLGLRKRGMDGPQGSVHRQNLRLGDKSIRLDYTFGKSSRPVAWMPRKTFFGYRYVSVTATGPVVISSLRSVPVSSITKEMERGTLTTGDPLVNKLIENTVWGMRSNYLSVPTDCPQRNERLGWTADTQVFAETGTFFADTDHFLRKWLRDLRDCQSAVGGYPCVAPFGQYGGDREMMRVGWADAGIIVPWTLWKQYGDREAIEESWESMERFITHVDETCYDHEALSKENGNYQYADWLSYEPLESCSGRALGPNRSRKPEAIAYWSYLCASYWAIDAGMMRDMAAATGRDASRYARMEARAKAYLRAHFLNDDGTFKNDILNTMQTPALFALRNGLVEGETRKAMIERLRANFAAHGNCLQTGFLGTSILMQTLTDCGLTDIAYTLLFQRKNPSWLYSIDNGATTIWERWNSYMIEKGMGPRGMNSFNHYAYGVVCQWLWETVAGIEADPECPGFRHIIMRPQPDRRLGHVDASYQSASGMIKSSWRYEGATWTWTFSIPEGTTASVTLPGETEAKTYQAGTYTVSQPAK